MEFVRSFLRCHLAGNPMVVFSQAIRAQEHDEYIIITIQNRGHCLSFPALWGHLIVVMQIAKKKKKGTGGKRVSKAFPNSLLL